MPTIIRWIVGLAVFFAVTHWGRELVERSDLTASAAYGVGGLVALVAWIVSNAIIDARINVER